MKGNAIAGQSGGPTAAINATLAGVISGLQKSDNVNKIFGMKNGIEGILSDNFIEIPTLSKEDLFSLSSTPASALGSCRKKLPEPEKGNELYENIFSFFKKHDVRFFFYIGGNDSMDTVEKLSKYAKIVNYDVAVVGVPKTIDNDLEKTDHTPGYGSAAKYIATVVEEICRDCAVYTVKAVTVVEIMGRDAGWLTAAAGLPRLIGEKTADLIYLPEKPFSEEEFFEDIAALFEKKPNIVVAVSEGLKNKDGKYIAETTQSGVSDIFGHKYLAGTAKYLEQRVKEKFSCKTRAVELNLPQRCASHLLSKTDIDESFLIGEKSVEFATSCPVSDGIFSIFEREKGEKYKISVKCIKAENIANKIKKVPEKYITRNNVSDELLYEIAPLIDGEISVPRKNGLPVYFSF